MHHTTDLQMQAFSRRTQASANYFSDYIGAGHCDIYIHLI